MENELYAFNRVCLYREDKKILHDLTFTIKRGECVAILGANGSGKSSLMKLMTGDLHKSVTDHPSDLRIFGESAYNVRAVKRKIGVITGDLQEKFRNLAPNATAFETVLSGLLNTIGVLYPETVTPERTEQTRACLVKYGLQEIAERSFDALSCGEAMKCLIARAAIAEPVALLLDEPMNGLDLTAKRDFLRGLKLYAQAGASIIMITHRIEEIIPQISRVILLKDGKIFANGAKADLLNDEQMTGLFSVPVSVTRHNEIYSAFVEAE